MVYGHEILCFVDSVISVAWVLDEAQEHESLRPRGGYLFVLLLALYELLGLDLVQSVGGMEEPVGGQVLSAEQGLVLMQKLARLRVRDQRHHEFFHLVCGRHYHDGTDLCQSDAGLDKLLGSKRNKSFKTTILLRRSEQTFILRYLKNLQALAPR